MAARVRNSASDAAVTVGALALAGLIVANAIHMRTNDKRSVASQAAARAEIAHDPIDLAALRSWGLSLDQSGRTAAAEAVMTFVSRQSWRDVPALVWLVPRRIREGDFVSATADADALMRLDIPDGLREPLIKMMIAAADDDGARPALVGRLADRPWWRESFLPRLAVAGNIAAARAVLLALADGPAPADGAEIAPLLGRQADLGAYADALRDWRRLTPTRPTHDDPVRDGDFSARPDPTVFGWSLAVGVGAQSAIEAAPGGLDGKALRIDYDGFSSPDLPRQLLVLGPGRYRVEWRERRDLAAPRRLDWTVRCADSGATISQVTTTPADNGQWSLAASTIIVPASGCQGQWLGLTASPGERFDPATIWYGRIKLVPQA